MNILKKIIALSLISGSLTFAILIIGEKNLPPEPNPLAHFPTENPRDLPTQKYIDVTENSTDQIAQDIVQELFARNPHGPIVEEGGAFINTLDPEQMVSKIFEDQISKIDLDEFTPSIEMAKLKIINNESSYLAENYFKNFRVILTGNFSKIGIDFSDPSKEDFYKMASALEKSINEFYNLLVPKNLAAIHQEQIRLMLVQKAVYNSLANYEEDSLKALIATQIMTEIHKQLDGLKREITAFIVKNHLNI